ncbi:MAG TPA: LacI family DNA-binding transcriptional regulator [Bacteroidota bacterium]|nr:LacI family DNA-binding transcriptional regulator [Bacteroidota bacterium]
MAITLSDIAKKSGISISTVSRVLNQKSKKYRISRKVELLVLQAAKDLHYHPNQLARSLRLKKTQSIGLVAPDISNPFFAQIIKTIQTELHKLHYSLVVCDSDENLELEVEHTHLLFSKGVDGLIVMPVGQQFLHFRDLLDNGVPVVTVDRGFDELETNMVVIDNYAGARGAVEHLIAHGHRRIAIIQGLQDTFTSLGRLEGYRDALKNAGIPFDENLVVGRDFRKENGYIETKVLLKGADTPTAIFTTSDLITLGALQAISEEGLEVPRDISIVAFDDLESAEYFRCPITAVAQPKEALGEMAVKLLMEELRSPGRHEKKKIILKPTLVLRNSVTACPQKQHAGTIVA